MLSKLVNILRMTTTGIGRALLSLRTRADATVVNCARWLQDFTKLNTSV